METSLEDIVKVGDEIELLVVRVNDVEGTVMCSKKRLDQAAGFEKVMNAGETGEVLTGIVTEVIKGGILVLTNGVKVFIPASQSGVPRDGDLSTLLRKEVNFKILETNRQRRRALGGIVGQWDLLPDFFRQGLDFQFHRKFLYILYNREKSCWIVVTPRPGRTARG